MQIASHKHIFIIDDALDNQELLRLLLESKGYVVECTSNGSEALHRLTELQILPHMILVDLRMPVMDGLEFLRRQNDTPRIRDIPTVLMSGDEDLHTIAAGAKSPEIGKTRRILLKPLCIAAVMNAVEQNIVLH